MCTSSDEGPPPPGGSCGRAGQSTAQCPTSQTRRIRIRAPDGQSPPCFLVPAGGTLQLRGVPSEGSGTYQWSTSSSRIRLENAQSETVTVHAGNQVSPSRDAETVRLRFTPTGCAALPEVTHQITVIRVRFSETTRQLYGYDNMDNTAGAVHHVSVKKNYQTRVQVNIEGHATADDLEFTSDDEDIARAPQPSGGSQFDLSVHGGNHDQAETLLYARVHCPQGPWCARLYADVYQIMHYWATVAKVWDSRSTATASDGSNATRLRFPNLNVRDAETRINGKYIAAVTQLHLTDHSATGGATDVRYDLDNNGKLTYEIGQGGRELDAINAAFRVAGQRVIIVRDMVSIYFLGAAAAAGATTITLKAAYAGGVFLKAGQSYWLGSGATREQINVTAATRASVTVTINPGLQFAHTTNDAVEFPAAGWSGNPILIKEGDTSETEIHWTIGHEAGHSLLELRDVDSPTSIMHYSQGATDHRLRYKELNKRYDTGTESQWETISRS